MTDENLAQIYVANPITTNTNSDLMYFVHSSLDAAMTFSNFKTQFSPPLTPTAHGILVGEGASPINSIVLTAGQILIGTTSGDPSAAGITSGTGISVTGGSGSITISFTGAQPWVDETGSSVTMVANNGYTSDDGASLVTFTLPTTSAIGDWVEINGKGSGGWSIAQAAGQQIHFGSVVTTLGAGGSLSSNNQYDFVRLRCLTANTIWEVAGVQGSLTYV